MSTIKFAIIGYRDVRPLGIFAPMSLPLRITFDGKDYTYRILTRMIDKSTNEIKILLGAQELTIFKNSKNEWDALERSIDDEPGLIREIARNVALRYRL